MSHPPQSGSGEPMLPPHGQPIPQQPWAASAPGWSYGAGQQPMPFPAAQYPAPQYPTPQYPGSPQHFVPQAPLPLYGAPPQMMLPKPYKDSTAAWLLWFFLGAFGAHHFYLGRTQWGVAYAIGFVASWVLAFVIIGFLGLIALFILWIVDATKMSERLQQCNAQAFAQNRSMGFA
jgi:TM2 domain-containing membrane protein YozV